jgi:hypothetical protein
MLRLALAGLPRILAKPNRDPLKENVSQPTIVSRENALL